MTNLIFIACFLFLFILIFILSYNILYVWELRKVKKQLGFSFPKVIKRILFMLLLTPILGILIIGFFILRAI